MTEQTDSPGLDKSELVLTFFFFAALAVPTTPEIPAATGKE